MEAVFLDKDDKFSNPVIISQNAAKLVFLLKKHIA